MNDGRIRGRMVIGAVAIGLVAALVPQAAAATVNSPDGELLVVAVNAKQGELHEGRLVELAKGIAERTPHAPDAVIVNEIIHSNLARLRDHLNNLVSGAPYAMAGITAKGQLDTDSNIKAKFLLNTATMEYRTNVHWTDACTTGRTYQLITVRERLAGGGTGRDVAIAGVHFAPSFKPGGSVGCKQLNAAEARRQMAVYADSGVMGDFNRRATTEYYECNKEELGPLEPWYEEMTGPSQIDGRIYRDTVRAAHFGEATMPAQWSFERETTETLCDGSVTHKRSRLDYIFVSDEMTPLAAGVDQGWGTPGPGIPGCDPTPDCKYSDHRFVWASVGISTHTDALSRATDLAVTAPGDGAGLSLTWGPTTGATAYDVYRYDPDLAVRNWVKIGSSDTAQYLDSAGLASGTTYHYRVVATRDLEHSRPSELASGTTAGEVNQPPAVTIDAPDEGAHFDGNSAAVAVAASATDDKDSSFTWRWTATSDHVTFDDATIAQTTAQLPQGEHTLIATATDAEGASHSASVTVLVQPNTAPIVTITSPEVDARTVVADSTGSATFTLAAEAEDETPGTLTWAWTEGEIPIASTATTSVTRPPGTYTFTATATDGHGVPDSDTVTVVVDEAPAFTEIVASSETTASGTTTGTLSNTDRDDGSVQTITEVSSGGKPSKRHYLLDHRWTFDVPASSSVEVAADAATSGEAMRLQYSTDGGQTFMSLFEVTGATSSLETSVAYSGGGTLIVRVVDAVRDSSDAVGDTVDIDQLVVKSYGAHEPPAPSPDSSMRVSDLLGSTTTKPKGMWAAAVRITVVDHTNAAVDGATVDGVWSAGSTPAACTTEADGMCIVTSSDLKRESSVRLEITDVTKDGLTYDASQSVTAITVLKP